MKYGVRVVLGAEEVERLGWGAFAILDRALWERGPRLAGEVGRWELAWAKYDLPTDAWLIAFQVWPPE